MLSSEQLKLETDLTSKWCVSKLDQCFILFAAKISPVKSFQKISLKFEPKIYYFLPKWNYNKRYNNISDYVSHSVKLQMLSDVPVGCQLSGGTDSSLITYIALVGSPKWCL